MTTDMEKLRADFMACKTYEEYDARREEFRQLGTEDNEVIQHLFDLLGKGEPFETYPDGVHVEVGF